MHLGVAILGLAGVIGAVLIVIGAGSRDNFGIVDGVGAVMIAVGAVFAIVSASVLIGTGISTAACEQFGHDTESVVDFSWLRGCRTQVMLFDGSTVWLHTDSVRLTDDLQFVREG